MKNKQQKTTKKKRNLNTQYATVESEELSDEENRLVTETGTR